MGWRDGVAICRCHLQNWDIMGQTMTDICDISYVIYIFGKETQYILCYFMFHCVSFPKITYIIYIQWWRFPTLWDPQVSMGFNTKWAGTRVPPWPNGHLLGQKAWPRTRIASVGVWSDLQNVGKSRGDVKKGRACRVQESQERESQEWIGANVEMVVSCLFCFQKLYIGYM
jgi:hypothetical protein